MNIKAASEATGVSADTIRYYERIGLIPPVKRSEVGIRIFDDEDLRWIFFSRQMRNAGISIEALIEYLTLFKEGKRTVPARLSLLDDQKEILENRIQILQEALDRLNFKIDNYHTHMAPAEDQLRDFDE
ncbi:MerR family transcriptional regulator [Enterococcus sp. BWB1-3]|uniref:MerR family transcriptional regulator n=1 Tax=unclassified Enterococcus TaxID=2608891 RepID=UPI0019224878|nr:MULTISPECIES: MerR family transcriptional regulator [unclassified Enterococcus]MBL1230711.1 MerR family transcriptional regulator [Enterococcus sp. BWB1-3]MCB5950678.1 MerR family transcriptional regulator [Enterococcus sp. BWT-B8]